VISIERLTQMLDKATYVRVIHGTFYVWHGGGYINVHGSDGTALTCFGVSDKEREYVDDLIEQQANQET